MHGALSSDEDGPLPLALAFLDGLTNSNNGTSSIPNTAVHGLVKHHDTAGELSVAEAESGSSGLANDHITGAEERAQCLCSSVSVCDGGCFSVTYAPEIILLEVVAGLKVEVWIGIPSDLS
jgi:hypothetical protein